MADEALVIKTNEQAKTSSSLQWIVPVFIALFSLAVSAFTSYNSTDKATATRIAVVETQQKNDGERLRRIEDKVDRILDLAREK